MRVTLRPAIDSDIAFCEALTRGNMAHYHAARGVAWDRERFLATWGALENHMLLADGAPAGALRLLANNDALEIRDLQVMPAWQNRGIGSWAIAWSRAEAVRRGFARVGLRVFADNPASRLYERLGFNADAVDDDGKIHMVSPAA